MRRIGRGLAARRKTLGLTQEEISRASLISKMESGGDIYFSTFLSHLNNLGALEEFLDHFPLLSFERAEVEEEQAPTGSISTEAPVDLKSLRKLIDLYPDRDIAVLPGTALAARKEGYAVRKDSIEGVGEVHFATTIDNADKSHHEYQTNIGFVGGKKPLDITLGREASEALGKDIGVWREKFVQILEESMSQHRAVVNSISMTDEHEEIRVAMLGEEIQTPFVLWSVDEAVRLTKGEIYGH